MIVAKDIGYHAYFLCLVGEADEEKNGLDCGLMSLDE